MPGKRERKKRLDFFSTYYSRLYVQSDRLTSEAKSQLCVEEPDGVKLYPYNSVASHINDLLSLTEDKIWVCLVGVV